MSLARTFATIFLFFLFATSVAFCPEHSATNALDLDCSGHDLLAELRRISPQQHNRIVERSRSMMNSRHMLWRIANETGSATSYLLGTVHISNVRLQSLTEATRKAILDSNVVVLEGQPASPAAQRRQIARSAPLMFSRGTTLADVLDDDEVKVVEKALEASGLASRLAHRLKPWAASMFLARSPCEEGRQRSGQQPMDVLVAEFASVNNRPLRGLETTFEQYNAMASLPDSAQIAWLRSSIRLIDRLEDMTETTALLYEKRLMPAVWDLTLEYSGEALTQSTLEIIRSALVDRRNLLMRDRAAPLLQRGAFIAVGALHLPGPTGLVNLLRESGYKVEPVE